MDNDILVNPRTSESSILNMPNIELTTIGNKRKATSITVRATKKKKKDVCDVCSSEASTSLKKCFECNILLCENAITHQTERPYVNRAWKQNNKNKKVAAYITYSKLVYIF